MAIADQPDLANDELHALLDPYREQYPVDYDDMLGGLEGKRYFHCEDLDRVAEWKFSQWPARLKRTRNELKKNSDRDIEDLTAPAFGCNDDLGAMLLLRVLTGVGKALGSAILVAHDAARYSVIDVNAVRAIQGIGYLRDCPAPSGQDDDLPPWVRYLGAVRDVAIRTGWTLREVDRALYKSGRGPRT